MNEFDLLWTDDEMQSAREESYRQGATDMEQAKQIIIDSLLKQIEQIRTDAIDEFKIEIINKINYEEKWLFECKSNNADTGIVFNSLKTFTERIAEAIKGEEQ